MIQPNICVNIGSQKISHFFLIEQRGFSNAFHTKKRYIFQVDLTDSKSDIISVPGSLWILLDHKVNILSHFVNISYQSKKNSHVLGKEMTHVFLRVTRNYSFYIKKRTFHLYKLKKLETTVLTQELQFLRGAQNSVFLKCVFPISAYVFNVIFKKYKSQSHLNYFFQFQVNFMQTSKT